MRGARGVEAKAGGEDNTVLQCSNSADKHFYFAAVTSISLIADLF